MINNSIIDIQNLYKTFKEKINLKWLIKLPYALFKKIIGIDQHIKPVLNDLSFQITDKVIAGFLGPNGAGKSTCIKIMLNLLKKDCGKCFILDHNIDNEYDKILQKTGALVEIPVFYDYLTGYENLEILKIVYDEINRDKIEKCLKQVGLYEHKDKKVSKYSVGMRQRLYIAKLLLLDFKLIVLDEPTLGMDPHGQVQMRELIKELSKKSTIFFSSHQLYEIEQTCDYVVIINEGKLVASGKVENLLKNDIEIYEIETNQLDIEKCLNFLKNLNYVLNVDLKVKSNNKYIEVKIKSENVPQLFKQLANSEFIIYNFVKLKQNLENYFLELTSKNC